MEMNQEIKNKLFAELAVIKNHLEAVCNIVYSYQQNEIIQKLESAIKEVRQVKILLNK